MGAGRLLAMHSLRCGLTQNMFTLSAVNLNHMIKGYIDQGNLNTARVLFDNNSHCLNNVSWNLMMSGYIKHNHLQQAEDLFHKMPQRDVVSWNTMFSGFRQANELEKCYQYFLHMRRHGDRPHNLTFAILISTCLETEFSVLIPQLHGQVICSGVNLNAVLGSALMRGYIYLWHRRSFCQVFDEILVKDMAPWNVLVLGYMEFGLTNEAQEAFNRMPLKNAISWSTLINGYVKNKMLHQARYILDLMNGKDVVSWSAMLKGYVQWGNYADALELFAFMLSTGIRPNHFTFSSVLDACAGCSSLLTGSQVHSCIFKLGVRLDVILSTSLLDMYAKCGDIEAAYYVFQSIIEKNLVSWNSIIGGYARHGLAARALELFDRMINDYVRPDEITFVNVLSACVHGGLVEEGEKIFNSMEMKYAVKPEMEHYACMVNLYGKAGSLEISEKLINGMPFEPDVVVWGALLGACGLHSSLELGEAAACGIYKMEHDHPAVYSTLSKMHGEKGLWSNVTKMKKMIRSKHVRKQNAGSWIDSPI